MTLLQVEHLTVEIGGNRVVDDVSFAVDRGERLGIIGESGSGKTLSVLSIVGLGPDVATVSGSVDVRRCRAARSGRSGVGEDPR